MDKKKIKTLFFVAISIGIIVFGIFKGKGYLKNKNRPNIILITLDALRADHLGCYGYPKDTSPFIDSIAKESIVFRDCIVQSASTVPSMSSIFTSKFPYIDGAVTPQYTLGQKYMTLAESLKERGYTTVAISGHKYVKKMFGFSRGFDYYNDDYKRWRNADEFLEIVTNFFDEKDIKRSFFLWMHIREPHAPYIELDDYIKHFSEPFAGEIESQQYEICGSKHFLTNKKINDLVARYDGNIRYADDNLKKIFDYFKNEGLLKDSIIIITADHGESLGEHNIFDHNHLYYGILHVPLIVKIPNKKEKYIDYPVSSLDIFPTILEILGYQELAAHLELRGKSLLMKRGPDYVQFSESFDSSSVIKQGWRLFIDSKNNNSMLYNINHDPKEKNNLINDRVDIYESLHEDLDHILSSTKEDGTIEVDKKAILSKEDIESLKALGYIN